MDPSTSDKINQYRITGQTHYGHHRLNIPLISEILPGLWMGGCINRVELPEDFDYVASLYPWEKYTLGPKTERIEIEAYDGEEVPDFAAEARELYEAWRGGDKVLVHCQAGLNRSGLFVAQMIMHAGRTAEEAIQLLRDNRDSAVLCNPHFEDHLISISGPDSKELQQLPG